MKTKIFASDGEEKSCETVVCGVGDENKIYISATSTMMIVNGKASFHRIKHNLLY